MKTVENPGRTASGWSGLLIAFGLGALSALAIHLAWDASASHDFTLPSAKGKIIKAGGSGRGEADEDWQPPAQDQRDTFVGVQFGSTATVRANCGRTPSGGWAGGCERRDGTRIPLLIVPNPCGVPEPYALMLCHEIGHAEGWEVWHGGGHFARHADLYAVRLDGTDHLGRRLEWATTVQASSRSDAEAKARRKAHAFMPWFRADHAAAFN